MLALGEVLYESNLNLAPLREFGFLISPPDVDEARYVSLELASLILRKGDVTKRVKVIDERQLLHLLRRGLRVRARVEELPHFVIDWSADLFDPAAPGFSLSGIHEGIVRFFSELAGETKEPVYLKFSVERALERRGVLSLRTPLLVITQMGCLEVKSQGRKWMPQWFCESWYA